jgi:hypothetical protein
MGILLVASGGLTIAYVRAAPIGLLLFFGLA